MSFEVIPLRPFEKQLKRLVKKYPSLKAEIAALTGRLEKDPQQGTSLGRKCYKIRLAITSKGSGKSGGARVVTHVRVAIGPRVHAHHLRQG
ncbi:MAG: hypothetical protein QM724_05150 [Flavobacteriales bacterium]